MTALSQDDTKPPLSSEFGKVRQLATEGDGGHGIRLSCIVVAFNMRREAQRTLHTLSAAYQHGVSAADYEVIVVENGSSEPLDEAYVSRFGGNFRLVINPRPSQSPAGALNCGRAQARGDIIVSMIDGARMLSPSCIAATLQAFTFFPDAAVTVPSWHLGPDVQNESIRYGYDQTVEDRLLDSTDWKQDGYELFSLCERLDPSSEGSAWFRNVDEANFIAVRNDVYDRLGGFDERFTSRGGGAVNLDFFRRVVEDSGCRIVSLLGEATFHQFHGGVSTNVAAKHHPWKAIAAEYREIRGKDWAKPAYEPLMIGSLSPQCVSLLARSPNVFTCDPGRPPQRPRYHGWAYRALTGLMKRLERNALPDQRHRA